MNALTATSTHLGTKGEDEALSKTLLPFLLNNAQLVEPSQPLHPLVHEVCNHTVGVASLDGHYKADVLLFEFDAVIEMLDGWEYSFLQPRDLFREASTFCRGEGGEIADSEGWR